MTFVGLFICEIASAFTFNVHRNIFCKSSLNIHRQRLIFLKQLRLVLNYILLLFLGDSLQPLVLDLFLYDKTRIHRISLSFCVYKWFFLFYIYLIILIIVLHMFCIQICSTRNLFFIIINQYFFFTFILYFLIII